MRWLRDLSERRARAAMLQALTAQVDRLLAGDGEAVYGTAAWPIIAIRGDRGTHVPNRHVELFPLEPACPEQQQAALQFTFPFPDWVRLDEDPTGGKGHMSLAYIPGGRKFVGTIQWGDPRSLPSMEQIGELTVLLISLRREDRRSARTS